MRLVEAVLPERLGRQFRWLWPSHAVAQVADGIFLAAGPLLVASLTREPAAIASAVFAQRAPWLLFGVVAGAIVDRFDRRRLILLMDLFRILAFVALATAVATDRLSVAVIYAAMFAIGTAETFGDNAASTLVPLTVPSESLGRANARLMGSHMVANQLAGPPLGALLFGLGAAVPFGVNAILFALAAALVARVSGLSSDDLADRSVRMRTQVSEGVRWLWGHPAVRMLAVLITVFNVTFGAAFSMLVLYALERLGLGEVGFGLLLSASAVGGLLGSTAFGTLERRFSYATLLRVGLVVETFTHLGLALTDRPIVAGAILLVFGGHAATWGSVSSTIRQRAVPRPLLGRVNSVYMIGNVGAFAIGTALGGAIGQRWGVLAPFWFAFVGAAITTVLVWRSIDRVAAAGEAQVSASR